MPRYRRRTPVVIEDSSVSRNHAELYLDPDQDQAWLVDRSTNGTWLNGARMERSVSVQIMPGDRVQVGPVEFQFRASSQCPPKATRGGPCVRSR